MDNVQIEKLPIFHEIGLVAAIPLFAAFGFGIRGSPPATASLIWSKDGYAAAQRYLLQMRGVTP